jgi:UrcA family protein
MTNLFNAGAAALCAVATIMSAATANARPAQTEPDTGGVAVAYGDLDINHADGAQALYARIRAAATYVCGGLPDMRDLEDMAQFNACFRATIHRAVDQVGAPLVWTVANQDAHRTAEVASR